MHRQTQRIWPQGGLVNCARVVCTRNVLPLSYPGKSVGAVHRASGHSGGHRECPRGSLVAPDGSPGPSKYVIQFISVKVSTLFPSLPCSALQPARACKRLGHHSQPDNHGAICPDPVARLAPRSQGRVDSGYRVARNNSEGFRVNLDPLAERSRQRAATSAN